MTMKENKGTKAFLIGGGTLILLLLTALVGNSLGWFGTEQSILPKDKEGNIIVSQETASLKAKTIDNAPIQSTSAVASTLYVVEEETGLVKDTVSTSSTTYQSADILTNTLYKLIAFDSTYYSNPVDVEINLGDKELDTKDVPVWAIATVGSMTLKCDDDDGTTYEADSYCNLTMTTTEKTLKNIKLEQESANGVWRQYGLAFNVPENTNISTITMVDPKWIVGTRPNRLNSVEYYFTLKEPVDLTEGATFETGGIRITPDQDGINAEEVTYYFVDSSCYKATLGEDAGKIICNAVENEAQSNIGASTDKTGTIGLA